jgi:uncharacterized membrane protein
MAKSKKNNYLDKFGDIGFWNGLIPLVIFLVLSIPTGAYLLARVPAFWAPDGGAHVDRVFQIAQGTFRAQYIDHNHGVGYGGYIPINLDNLENVELNMIGNAPAPPGQETLSKFVTKQDRAEIAQASDQKVSKQPIIRSFVNSAAYSPVAYAPNVVGVFLGLKLNLNLGHILLLGRIFGFLTFLFCVGYSLYTLRKSSFKWVVMTVSLLPLVIFQTTSITADSFLFSVAILFSSLIIKGCTQYRLNTLDKTLLFICAVILPLLKSVYFALSFLLLLIPRKQWSSVKRYWLFTAPALLLSLIGFAIWTHMTSDIAASTGLVRGDMIWKYGDASIQKKFVLSHPFGFLHVLWDSLIYGSKFYVDTLFGFLGFTYLPIPGVADAAGYSALGLSVLLVGKNRFKKYTSGLIMSMIGLTILIIFTTLYIYYSPVKNSEVQGVQGRYFIPVLILAIASLSGLVPKLRIDAKGVATGKIILTVLISLCLVFSIIRYGLAITA